MHYLFLCVWLLSFKIMFVKFILACRCRSFILTAVYLLFVLMYHNAIYCQRAVGCFLVFGCINSPSVNILHIFFWCFACLMGICFRIVWSQGKIVLFYGKTVFPFGKIVLPNNFLKQLYQFTLPLKTYEHSRCSTPSPTLSIFGHLNIKCFDK